ncbi:MAG: hypothetical protein LBL75_02975 [Rickettsiales bacterium]|jgi:hypothetical protein|nr:hypothetical protein [Rickettsiales bacterium]
MFNTKKIIARNEKNIAKIKQLEQENQKYFNLIDVELDNDKTYYNELIKKVSEYELKTYGYRIFQDNIINFLAEKNEKIAVFKKTISDNNSVKMVCYHNISDRDNDGLTCIYLLSGITIGYLFGIGHATYSAISFVDFLRSIVLYTAIGTMVGVAAAALLNYLSPATTYKMKADKITPAYSKKIFNDMSRLYPEIMKKAGVIDKLK